MEDRLETTVRRTERKIEGDLAQEAEVAATDDGLLISE